VKLRNVFKAAKKNSRAAFMPYLCAGYPTIKDSLAVAESLARAGADVIEVGMPFSDPIADGPTIQRAGQRALDAGMDTKKYLLLCRQVSEKTGVPLVAMSYYNILLQYGLAEFASEAAECGVAGVIVPDLPVEESADLKAACKAAGLDLIFLVAPTTGDARLKAILKKASGFLYVVSLTGVTGARETLSDDVRLMASKLKKKTKLPLCIGFGVKTPKQVAEAVKLGYDGVIVGSALIDVLEKNIKAKKRMIGALESKAASLAGACGS